ncbi:MAG TPA: hypothetical protein VK445_07920, partial [Dissulfurispiraceae bacterium]|nr:hypothetical protein [Dissulfurispiraceae bacterium]
GYGENSRTLINIPAKGGTVTIDGSKVPTGSTVKALGLTVPVDRNGKFAVRQLMPAGPNMVEVSVTDEKGAGMVYRRSISIPDKDWFYIGLADLTIGRNNTTGPAKLVTGDETRHYENKTYIDGRGAFYLKGLIKGEYLLTMSADTREQPVQNLFKNFDAKDPMYLLRRIDPDVYYPVYGDDSTIVDDAPTQGKFYVKIERGDSSVMWGNFQTQWAGTELTQYSRGLYGANLVLAPTETTSYGERRTALNAFIADPGTLASREEFRGTGGSLYYLRHMDITQGSERIWVEVRDKDSLITLERRLLAPAQDYDVNYLQGRILLRSPLSAVADGSTLIQTTTLNGNPVYMVVTYEYVPGLTATHDLAAGIRATHWFGDILRLGITGYRQGEDQSAQRLKGADVMLRYKPGTYLKGEFARSEGAGTGQLTSITGGFDFAQQAGTEGNADAWRLEGALDFSELWKDGKGRVTAYWQHRDHGFSGPGMTTFDNERLDQAGFLAHLPVGESTTVDVKADERDAESQTFRAVEANVRQKLGDEFTLSVGARHDNRSVHTPNASSILSEDGGRTDAIVRLDYRPLQKPEQAIKQPEEQTSQSASGAKVDEKKDQTAAQTGKDATAQTQSAPVSSAPAAATSEKPVYAPWGLYGFVQGTLSATGNRQDNDRVGVGGFWQATPRFKLDAEISAGDGGLGGKLSGDYRIDDRSNVYLTYTMETERPDSIYRGRMGTLVFGSAYKLSDQVRVYGESKWAQGAGPDSLVHAFGLDYSPNDRWTYGVKAEYGTISDEFAGDLKRKALGLSLAYKFEKTKLASALEYRDETGSLGDRHTWLMKNSLGYQVDPSWRLLGKFNFSYSDSSQGAFYDANYMEFVAGAALRPVSNDKLNALFKYTYYYNLPSPGQLAPSNIIADYAQRSHVLSVDTIYDLFPWLSVGAKYGFRLSELKQTKVDGDWFNSHAHLFIIRTDLHFVKEWDALAEWRYLKATEAGDAKTGFLIGLYRHITENVKIGAGYNFTDFSDNLTDLSYRSRGFFVNVVGSF